MAKKPKSPPMVMKEDDVAYRHRLLVRWGFVCIICGMGFANLACVTKEHVVPHCRSRRMKNGTLRDNLAPTHHQCNKIRGCDSILVAAKRIEQKRQTMKPHVFLKWLNAPVPHRVVPPSALRPLTVRQCLELPEHLPGMSWG